MAASLLLEGRLDELCEHAGESSSSSSGSLMLVEGPKATRCGKTTLLFRVALQAIFLFVNTHMI